MLSLSIVSDCLRPHGCRLPGSSVHEDSLGKNTGVGCPPGLFFPTQESNPDLLHCRRILYCLSHQGSPGHFGEMLKEFKPTLKNNLEDQAWLFFFKSFVQLVRSLPSSNDNLAFYFLLLSLCISSSPMFL